MRYAGGSGGRRIAMPSRCPLVAAVVVACGSAFGQARKPWTILVYGAADNNADGPILQFLDKVRKAIDDDPGVDLLLLIDRSEKYSKDARLLGEDFTGARLFRLKKDRAERLSGGEFFPEITTTKDAEINSADAANIGKFVAWGKSVSPAERYGLMIYSHANGRTMCPDEECKGEMGIAELSDKAQGHVDFLALELCEMGGIEIAYQWRPGGNGFSADVLLAIPNAGPPLDWDRAFARIRTPGHDTEASGPPVDPSKMTAREFGSLVIEEGRAGRELHNASMEAAASYDLKAAAAVKESVDAMARVLAKSDGKSAFLGLREAPPEDAPINYSEGGPYVDLFDVCERAAACAGLSEEARKAARVVMEKTDAFVLDSFGMEGHRGFKPGKNGVFIVMPRPGNWGKFAWYTPEAGTGKDYGRWSFLRDGAKAGDGVVDNWFELLDSWLDEQGGPGGGANGYKP